MESSSFSCSIVVAGLSSKDCDFIQNIGFAGQGTNPTTSSSPFWIGHEGPNTLDFTNDAATDVVLTMWYREAGDDGASFVEANAPLITYSLAAGASVTISAADGVSGGWSGVYYGSTVLTKYGQIANTWGEFTTGQYGTVDVSRLVNMDGNSMSIKTNGGCTTDMSTCVYQCKSGKSLGRNLVQMSPY